MESSEDNYESSESLEVEPCYISDGPIIKTSLKSHCEKLLTGIGDLKDIVDINLLTTLLNQIINHKSEIKYKDPLLYLYYVYDGRAGYFKASGYCLMSEFVTLKICEHRFYYSDVLGKHSELDFTMEDIQYDYIDSESDDDYGYTLHLDYPRIFYDNDVYEKLLDYVKKYMYSLPYISINEFKSIRYDALIDYATDYLNTLIATTNPIVQIQYNEYSSSYMNIRLSLYLTYLCKEPSAYIVEPNKSNRFGSKHKSWSSTEVKVQKSTETSERVFTDLGLRFDSYCEIETQIKDLLATYPASNPVDFYNTYFKSILDICKTKYPSSD